MSVHSINIKKVSPQSIDDRVVVGEEHIYVTDDIFTLFNDIARNQRILQEKAETLQALADTQAKEIERLRVAIKVYQEKANQSS